MEYRKDIDGLRAISVLGVVFFHAGMSTFSGGFIGVDVFFVITGYLISIIILYDAGRGEFSFLSFYERRIRRIAPILVCVVLCSSVASYFLLTPREMEVFSRLSVSSLLLSSNIELLISNESYFGFLYRAKPLIHTWSLSLEEQFYFIFPALLILAWRRGERFLLWSALMVAALSLALAEWGARHHPNASFYLLPTRGWEFLVGFLAAHVTRLYGEKKNSLLSMAGLAAVLFSIFFYDSRIPHPGLYTVLPVLGTACILIYGTSGTLTATLLKVKPLGLIGLMSYSVYLWHQPFFSFYEALTFQPQTEGYVLLTAVTLGLSYLTWRFIEQPARDRVRCPRRPLFTSLAAVIVTFFPSDCLRGLTSCHFSRDAVLARQQFYRTDMMRLAEAYGAKVFDPLNFICNPESGDCSVTREGKSLYRDSHHLSLYGSSLYGQAFADWLGKQPYPWGQVAPAEATSAREPAKPLP